MKCMIKGRKYLTKKNSLHGLFVHFIVYGINIQYNRIVSNHLSIPDNLGNVVKIDMSFLIVTVTFMIAQMIIPE